MSQSIAPVLIRSIDGSIQMWNPSAESAYGWEAELAVGKSSHKLFQTVFPYSLDEINRQLLTKGVWEGELIHTLRNGRKVRVTSRWELSRAPSGDSLTVFEINSEFAELPGKVIPFPLSRMIPKQLRPSGSSGVSNFVLFFANYWLWWLIPLVLSLIGIILLLALTPAALPPAVIE